MNLNEQPQTNRDEEMREQARRDLEDQREQAISTRELAGGAAKTARVKNSDQLHRDSNKRESEATGESGSTPLFEIGEAEALRTRWMTIQTQFVDEPRRSVEQADELVASAMKRLAEIFANEREGLEHNWDSGDDVSTEDLRIALQRYRSFFDRLLSV
jgi:hypothetical protein